MNERIADLFIEAMDAIPEHMEFNIPKEFTEKFAELIVEEVYDYILNATFDDEPWPSRKDVRQHFGVEE